jgi:hypothetical protein
MDFLCSRDDAIWKFAEIGQDLVGSGITLFLGVAVIDIDICIANILDNVSEY